MATIGSQPSAIYLNAFLENEVLQLTDKLIPLKSSHTGDASTNEGGAPVKDESDLSDKGMQTKT